MIPSAQVPTCCPDAAGGDMVATPDGWLCVWCSRLVPATPLGALEHLLTAYLTTLRAQLGDVRRMSDLWATGRLSAPVVVVTGQIVAPSRTRSGAPPQRPLVVPAPPPVPVRRG